MIDTTSRAHGRTPAASASDRPQAFLERFRDLNHRVMFAVWEPAHMAFFRAIWGDEVNHPQKVGHSIQLGTPEYVLIAPDRDRLEVMTALTLHPNGLMVHSDSPRETVKEIVQWGREFGSEVFEVADLSDEHHTLIFLATHLCDGWMFCVTDRLRFGTGRKLH